MDRRSFLAGLGAALLVGCGGPALGLPELPEASSRLAPLVGPIEAAGILPRGRSAARAALVERLGPVRSEEEGRRVLLAAIRSDFRDGRVVHADGWVLAQTEALLVLALAS